LKPSIEYSIAAYIFQSNVDVIENIQLKYNHIVCLRISKTEDFSHQIDEYVLVDVARRILKEHQNDSMKAWDSNLLD